MAKPAEALAGLFGAYASDDEGNTPEEDEQPQDGDAGGRGVVLLDVEEDGAAVKPEEHSEALQIEVAAAAMETGQPDQDEEFQDPAPAQEASPSGTEDSGMQLPESLAAAPTEPCPAALQEKIAHYLEIQQTKGTYINVQLRRMRGYRNPDFLQKMVKHFNIDELGTCYPPKLWNPAALPPSDYYDELAKEWSKFEEQRRQDRQKVDFVKATAAAAIARNSSSSLLSVLKAGQVTTGTQVKAQVAGSKRMRWDASAAVPSMR